MAFVSYVHSAEALFKQIVLLHLFNLGSDVLENTISTEIIELSKSGVHSFSVTERNSRRAISFIHSLGLVVEYYLIQLLRVNDDLDRLAVMFVEDAVV